MCEVIERGKKTRLNKFFLQTTGKFEKKVGWGGGGGMGGDRQRRRRECLDCSKA